MVPATPETSRDQADLQERKIDMSQRTVCDGCGKTLDGYSGDYAIKGERADKMMAGAGLPDDAFDWCLSCAQIAFAAVKDAARD